MSFQHPYEIEWFRNNTIWVDSKILFAQGFTQIKNYVPNVFENYVVIYHPIKILKGEKLKFLNEISISESQIINSGTDYTDKVTWKQMCEFLEIEYNPPFGINKIWDKISQGNLISNTESPLDFQIPIEIIQFLAKSKMKNDLIITNLNGKDQIELYNLEIQNDQNINTIISADKTFVLHSPHDSYSTIAGGSKKFVELFINSKLETSDLLESDSIITKRDSS